MGQVLAADGDAKREEGEVTWDRALDLEQWVRKALAEGQEAEVVTLLRTMSPERRGLYRDIYTQWKQSKKREQS